MKEKIEGDKTLIKENQKHFNRLQVVIDAFVIVISYVMAWVIKFQILKNDDGKLPFRTICFAMVCIVAVYLLLYNLFSSCIHRSVFRGAV